MDTIIGIDNLKDAFRKAKLMCGDFRGLKNKFELSEKFGIPAMQTAFYSVGGNGDERMELVADCYGEGNQCDIYAYTMKGLVDDIETENGTFHVDLVCLKWNKSRNDADRKTIMRFYYKNN